MSSIKISKKEKILTFIAWVSGILVSLTVGYSLIKGPLILPEVLGKHLVSNITGWVIIVTTLLSLILSLKRK